MRTLLILYLASLCCCSWGQSTTDSIKQLLLKKKQLPDSLQHDRLSFIAKEHQKDYLDSSHVYFQQALHLAREIDDTLRIIMDLRDIGDNFLKRGNEYSTQALDYLRSAWLLAQHYGLEKVGNTGYWLSDLGNIYYAENIWSIARSYYRKAKAEFQSHQDSFGIILCYRNLALCYQYDEEQCDSSRYFFKKALDLQKAYRQDYESMIAAYNYMSLGYFCDNQYEEGLFFVKKSYALAKENDLPEKDPRLWAKLNYNIASHYIMDERLEEGKPYYDTFKEVIAQYPELQKIFSTHILMTEKLIAQRAKNYEKALELTLKIIARGQLPAGFLAKQYEVAAEFYHALGRHEEALDAKDKYIAILKKNTKDKLANKVVDMYATIENYEQRRALEIKELALSKERALKQKEAELKQFYAAGLLGLALLLLLLVLLLRRVKRQNKTIVENAASLESLNQTKDKLMSILAHDLRGPFGHIQELSKQLRQQLAQRAMASDLQRRAQSLHQVSRSSYLLFEDLLSWSKNQSGNMRFAPEALQLPALFQEVFTLLQSQLDEKHIQLHSDFQVTVLKADPDMLRIILRNLLTNALRASRTQRKIELRSWAEEKQVYIAVADEAGGIPEAEQARLFDENRWKQRRGNSGLGLVLCRQLVERHRGSIQLRSTPGKGSVFTLSFPEAFISDRPVEQDQRPVVQDHTVPRLAQLEALRPLLQLQISQATSFLRLRQGLPDKPELQAYLEQWQRAILAQDSLHFEHLQAELQDWLGSPTHQGHSNLKKS